jgi:hypothetical protein
MGEFVPIVRSSDEFIRGYARGVAAAVALFAGKSESECLDIRDSLVFGLRATRPSAFETEQIEVLDADGGGQSSV